MRRSKFYEPEENKFMFSIAQIESLHDEIKRNYKQNKGPSGNESKIVTEQILEAQSLIDKLDNDYKIMIKNYGTYLIQSELRRLKEMEKKIQELSATQASFDKPKNNEDLLLRKPRRLIQDRTPPRVAKPRNSRRNAYKLNFKIDDSELVRSSSRNSLRSSRQGKTEVEKVQAQVNEKDKEDEIIEDSQIETINISKTLVNPKPRTNTNTKVLLDQDSQFFQASESQSITNNLFKSFKSLNLDEATQIMESSDFIESKNKNNQNASNIPVQPQQQQQQQQLFENEDLLRIKIHKDYEYIHESKLPKDFWNNILKHEFWYSDIDKWD